jgi:hypothetical protein
MAATIIDWDGEHLPPELQALPPGRYSLSSIEKRSSEESAIVQDGLEDIDADDAAALESGIDEAQMRQALTDMLALSAGTSFLADYPYGETSEAISEWVEAVRQEEQTGE